MSDADFDEAEAWFEAEQERYEAGYEAQEKANKSAKVVANNQAGKPSSATVARHSWKKGYFVKDDGRTYLGSYDDGGKETEEHVSSGYAFISAILDDYEQNPPERYYVIKGKTVSGKAEFETTVKISAFVGNNASRKILMNLWAEDDLGDMSISVMKALSPRPVPHIRIMVRPAWVGGYELVAPGLTDDNTKFMYSRKVNVDFSAVGDVSAGKEAIRKGLLAFDTKNTVMLFNTIIGAPVVAKLWPGDRYGLFIQAQTQWKKTTAAMLFANMCGPLTEVNLVRWGDGATSNATEHIAANTGPFVFLLDNYKQYTDKDPGNLQKFIHAVVEGTEKDRLRSMNSEISLGQSTEYQCTPIITGEQYPGSDAATRSRIIVVNWTDVKNLEYLTEAQAHLADINAFGKAWFKWLNSDDGIIATLGYEKKFDEYRLKYIKKSVDSSSSGRIASNAAVVALVWEIFKQWPEAQTKLNDGQSLAEEFTTAMENAIDAHIIEAQRELSEQLDGQKFIDWLIAKIFTGKYYLTGRAVGVSYKENYSELIGEFKPADTRENRDKPEVFIRPEVLSATLLPAWQRDSNGTKTDRKALLRQLVSLGYIKYDDKNQAFTMLRTIDKKQQRVHVFLKIFDVNETTITGDT